MAFAAWFPVAASEAVTSASVGRAPDGEQ